MKKTSGEWLGVSIGTAYNASFVFRGGVLEKKIKLSENSNLQIKIMDALKILQDQPHIAAWIIRD